MNNIVTQQRILLLYERKSSYKVNYLNQIVQQKDSFHSVDQEALTGLAAL